MKIKALFVFFMLSGIAIAAQSDDLISIEGISVTADVDGKSEVIGNLAFSDDPFFGFGMTYSFSPEENAIAYIGTYKNSAALFVYTAGSKEPERLPEYGEITGRTVPVWSPDGNLVTYSMGNRVWVYDMSLNEAWIPTEPDDPYYEDIDPYFADDGGSVFFYRGTTFEFLFSGELYNVGLDGGGLALIPEELPKYPPEYLGAPEEEDPYIYSTMLLAESRAEFFAADLENHDYRRLLTYFPAWFVIMALEMSDGLGRPVEEDIFNNFLFNGAIMYEDYSNTITGIDEIKRVVNYEVRFFDSEIYFRVELFDGREVVFFLMFDQDTLEFVGAFG